MKASDRHTEEPASLQDMHEWVKVEKTSSVSIHHSVSVKHVTYSSSVVLLF